MMIVFSLTLVFYITINIVRTALNVSKRFPGSDLNKLFTFSNLLSELVLMGCILYNRFIRKDTLVLSGSVVAFLLYIGILICLLIGDVRTLIRKPGQEEEK